MIYTVTLNPSLDYCVGMSNFVQGKLNRASSEEVYAGGKGLNVSIVLNNLGYSTISFGFIGGIIGDAIEGLMNSYGCTTDFIRVSEGSSRVNIKISSKKETEINGKGPIINANCIDQLFGKLGMLGDGDVLVLAGSIPKSVPKTLYEDILRSLDGKGVLSVIDAEGELLTNALKYKPFLVKPNTAELEGIFGVKINTREEIAWYAKKLKDLGAQNVIASMGADGAILITEDGRALYSPAPSGLIINTVGSGDSLVAGFIAGYFDSNGDINHAFKIGVAAGSATAFKPWLATMQDVAQLV